MGSTYEVTRLTGADSDEWNRLVRASSRGTPFHLYECLEVFADYSDMRVHPLVSYKGREAIGVFPIFERSFSLVSTVFSPPPNLKVPYLGPILLDHDGASRSTLERRQWRFVRSCLDYVRSAIRPKYLHFRTASGYRDPRPFDWDGFDVLPGFTYVVDLTPGSELLFERFSGDVRSNVRDCDEAECAIEVSGPDGIRRTVDQVHARFAEQGQSYPIDASFLITLYERLPDGVVRPYVCTLDGEFVGGNVVFTSEGTFYPWVGAAAPKIGLGINDAIHWRAMRDGIDRGATSYDLVGADNERLSTYKSKFAPTLEPFYTFRKRTRYMRLAESVYERVH